MPIFVSIQGILVVLARIDVKWNSFALPPQVVQDHMAKSKGTAVPPATAPRRAGSILVESSAPLSAVDPMTNNRRMTILVILRFCPSRIGEQLFTVNSLLYEHGDLNFVVLF